MTYKKKTKGMFRQCKVLALKEEKVFLANSSGKRLGGGCQSKQFLLKHIVCAKFVLYGMKSLHFCTMQEIFATVLAVLE